MVKVAMHTGRSVVTRQPRTSHPSLPIPQIPLQPRRRHTLQGWPCTVHSFAIMRRPHTIGSFLHLLPSIVHLASGLQAGSVTWVSPAAGDVYKSGDTIVVQWTADGSFSSPSFSLCTSGSGSGGGSSVECGSAVWPIIEENGSTKMVHLYAWRLFPHSGAHMNSFPCRSLPASPAAASFYLQMSDATSGQSVSSPVFSLDCRPTHAPC